MATVEHAQQARIYRVGTRFTDRVLRASGSLYTARRVWTLPVLEGLHERLEDRGAPGRTFEERWQDLLTDAAPAVRQLAAEALLVHLLFPADLTGATKRRLLASTAPPAPPPGWIDAALDAGVAGTGVAYKATRLSQLAWLVRAVRAWKSTPSAERRAALAAPLGLRDWLAGLPPAGGQSQREALLHLLHPQAFEPIVSVRVKRRIVAAFGEHAAHHDDVDAALLDIRATLTPAHGLGFWFTTPALAARWRPPAG